MPNHGMTPHYSGTTLDAQVQLFSLMPVLHAFGTTVNFTKFDASNSCTSTCEFTSTTQNVDLCCMDWPDS